LRRISEELTRKEMIDPQLEAAGWYLHDHSKVKIEIPVDGYDAEPWNRVSDYCLYWGNFEICFNKHTYNADQIRFLRAVQSAFLQKRHLEVADLYDAPSLSGFGQDAVDQWFTENEVTEMVEFANRLAVE